MDRNEMKKGLNYTQTQYEEMADTAKATLENLSHEDDRTTSDAYGIYYNSLAGLLRAGVLCSRVTGTDGFPEIRIVSGSKSYQCREDVMRTILGEEADYIISPYEDKFESYLDPVIVYDIADPNATETEDGQNKGRQDIKTLKKQHRAEIENLKKKYETQIKDLKKQLATKPAKVQQEDTTVTSADMLAASEPIQVLSAFPEDGKAQPRKLNVKNITGSDSMNMETEEFTVTPISIPDPQPTIVPEIDDPVIAEKVQKLEQTNAQLIQLNRRSQSDINKLKGLEKEKNKLEQIIEKYKAEHQKQKEHISTLSQQLKQKTQALEEREKYTYDPVYDHYYSDELPELIANLESTRSDLIFKGIAMAGCVGGIVISAVMGFFQFL